MVVKGGANYKVGWSGEGRAAAGVGPSPPAPLPLHSRLALSLGRGEERGLLAGGWHIPAAQRVALAGEGTDA